MNCPGRKSKATGRPRNSERVSGPCSTTASSRPSSSTAMAGDLVDGVPGDPDDDLRVRILDHRLAPEARRRREAGRLVEEVLLRLLRLGEPLAALLHDDVARRARAVAAARVLEVNAVREQHVQDRAGTAVVLERRPRGVELDHPFGLTALELHTQLRHAERVTLAPGSRRCDWRGPEAPV